MILPVDRPVLIPLVSNIEIKIRINMGGDCLMKSALAAFTLIIGLTFAAVGAMASSHGMKPFVLAYQGPGDMASTVADVIGKLKNGGFEIAGSYKPYEAATVIVVTNDQLKTNAARSEFGAYGAAERVSVTKVNGEIQVAYTNPPYMASAYRMKGNLKDIGKQLQAALGRKMEYGMEGGMDDADLREYHYMFGMEYFSDQLLLATHGSYNDAVAALEKGLAAGVMGVTKVYRIDIPGKDESVFGVALNGAKGGGDQQDDRFLMSEIDFKPIRSTAHLPYEIVVSGPKTYALSARFRIAINFPDLSMIGDNSFMNIMDSPDRIKTALSAAAKGGK